MFAGVYMIMVFDPQILFNDGFYDLMEVRIPAGTLLKPLKPAALSCRTHALGRIFDILGGLLGQGNPQFMCAAGFSDSPHFMYSGHDRNGDWYQLYQITFGGIPGKPFGDGPDGHSLWPSFTNVPNEFLESYFPLRIDIYETIPDTGGPGKNRGGNGLRIGYRFLEPGESIEEACARELKEEAGLLATKVVYHSTQPWPYPSSLMIGCTARATNEDIIVDHVELEDCRWFDRAEATLMLKREHPDGLAGPHPFAIAHHLVGRWLQSSPATGT